MNIKRIAVTLMATLLLLIPLATVAQGNTVGKAATDFTLKTHDGKKLTLSKLKGKRGVVLVFFATWCPPCMAEVPHVKKFVNLSKDKNILVYGVNIQQSQRIIDKFVKDHKVNYRVLLDSDAKVAKAYKVTGIPTVIGIDAQGIVRYRAHGLTRKSKDFIKMLTSGLPKKMVPIDEKPVANTGAKMDDHAQGHDDVRFISKETLQGWMKGDTQPLIIDVLSPESYAKAHVEGAVNIPLAQLKDRAATMDKERRTVVYCASYECHASTAAARLLTSLGFKDVSDYKGGIKEWKEAGLPVGEK